jgi:transcriptional regulator with XRE-family HTH domain
MRRMTTLIQVTEALRERRQALGISQSALDAMTGLADGYTSKVEMSVTNPKAANARYLARESLPLMLGALGVELVLLSAAKTGKKMNDQNELVATVSERMAALGTKGARNKWHKMTPKQRRMHVLRMNKARRAKRKSLCES